MFICNPSAVLLTFVIRMSTHWATSMIACLSVSRDQDSIWLAKYINLCQDLLYRPWNIVAAADQGISVLFMSIYIYVFKHTPNTVV